MSLVLQTAGRIRRSGALGGVSASLRADGPIARAIRPRLPQVPGFLAVALVVLAVGALLAWPRAWTAGLLAIPLLLIGSVRLRPPRWLAAPLTAAVELGVLVAATQFAPDDWGWLIVATTATVVVVRAGAVTQLRFALGGHPVVFGWDVRAAVLLVSWAASVPAAGAGMVLALAFTEYLIDTVRSTRGVRPAARTSR